jgi:hypothetical protein
VVLALLACSSYSYSDETVFGTTGNAASDGYNWVMTNILPQQAGLAVNGVIYQYTTVKNTEDDMVVSVQNENARGSGYIFREVDDWSGIPGNTINKVIPVNNIDISYWGRGSIDWTGTGNVEDAKVIYTYQYDPCFDPQTDPTCPGYIDQFVVDLQSEQVEIVDPLDDDVIQDELDRKGVDTEDDDQEERDNKKMKSEKKIEERLEKILGIVNTTLLAADAVAKHEELISIAAIPTSYYSTIPGGVIDDAPKLADSNLPENKNALRVGLAQQVKHEKLVDLQYEK